MAGVLAAHDARFRLLCGDDRQLIGTGQKPEPHVLRGRRNGGSTASTLAQSRYAPRRLHARAARGGDDDSPHTRQHELRRGFEPDSPRRNRAAFRVAHGNEGDKLFLATFRRGPRRRAPTATGTATALTLESTPPFGPARMNQKQSAWDDGVRLDSTSSQPRSHPFNSTLDAGHFGPALQACGYILPHRHFRRKKQ